MSLEKRKISKLSQKLKLKDFKLTSLLEVTKAINKNLSTKELLGIYKSILSNDLSIEKIVLFIKNNEWQCLLNSGIEKPEQIDALKEKALEFSSISVIQSSEEDVLNGFDVIVPVIDNKKPIAYLLIGDLEEEDELTMSPIIKHLPFIQTITNFIAVAIENKRLFQDSLQQEVFKKELEVAAQMQTMLIPSSFPKNLFVEVEGYYQPHDQVGGDYYDYLFTANGKFVFCISDISGKGIPAGLLMSNFQANLRAIIKYNDFSLEKVVTELNKKVLDNTKGEKFITFFIGKYDPENRELEYINAGHNPPILYDGHKVKYLTKGCTILGMFDEMPSIESDVELIKPNSLLLSFTDGVPELENEKLEMYETGGLENILKSNFELEVGEINRTIIKSLEEFKGSMSYPDDTALLCTRFL